MRIVEKNELPSSLRNPDIALDLLKVSLPESPLNTWLLQVHNDDYADDNTNPIECR